jgi:hypothetical protein
LAALSVPFDDLDAFSRDEDGKPRSKEEGAKAIKVNTNVTNKTNNANQKTRKNRKQQETTEESARNVTTQKESYSGDNQHQTT